MYEKNMTEATVNSYEQNSLYTEDDFNEIVKFSAGNDELLRRSIKRLALGDPVVHITNRCSVLGRTFYVDRRVYRPSTNTAKLVSYALGIIEDGSRILDVGTGCGWIAITAKIEKPASIVYGVDIDNCAIDVACHNAKLHDVDVTFQTSDLVDSLDMDEPNYVIANLPYGTPDSTRNHPINTHMPRIALYHPEGAFAAVVELIESLKRRQWSPSIFLEAGSQTIEVIRAALPPHIEWDFVLLEPQFSILHIHTY